MTAAGCLQIIQDPHYHAEISPYFRRSLRALPSLEGSSEYSRLQAKILYFPVLCACWGQNKKQHLAWLSLTTNALLSASSLLCPQ